MEAANAREVYERYPSHADLLKHIKVPIVKKVAHCIRSWKTRHSLPTLEQAFAAHRQSILFAKVQALSETDASQHPPSPPPSAAAAPLSDGAQPLSDDAQPLSPPADVVQQQDDVIAGLVRDVAALRGLQLQHQTPLPLHFTLIITHFRNHCRVLSIVGDGRCQLYVLLQIERAMLPTSYEADELRRKLKAHLLQFYTEEEWRERVPSDLREIISLQQFAERYLSDDTTHLPHDSIALWQDLRQRSTDVFILNKSPQGEHVEKIPCRGTARDAVVLLFTWHGVGHYELVTYNNVICLPRNHSFILHLDELHRRYIAGLSKEVKRAAHDGRKRSAAERESDVDAEDEAAISAITPAETLRLANHQLRLALEAKMAENDNLHRLQRQHADRLPQPEDSPTINRELRHSKAFMHRYLSINVPPTPGGNGVIILHPSPSLEVPPTPADPCCICRVESADTALSPCKHRCCQRCWTREKKELVRMNEKKRRLNKQLDLPAEPLVFLCPLCRQVVEDRAEQTD